MHRTTSSAALGAATTAAYIAAIPTANLATSAYGTIPAGFGLSAPAGVLLFGATFVLRDLIHSTAGRNAVLAAIAAGTALSYLVAPPALATASAAAFLAAELADTAVYSPLRARGLLVAVAASNAVGIAIDSVLFLHLAFGSLNSLPGLVLAKTYLTAAALLALALIRPRTTKPEARR